MTKLECLSAAARGPASRLRRLAGEPRRGNARLIPEDLNAALDVRFFDRAFDNFVMARQQVIGPTIFVRRVPTILSVLP